MKNQHDQYFRNNLIHYPEEEEREVSQNTERAVRIIFGGLVFVLLLIFSNGIFTKNVPVEGVVMSSKFLEGEWVGRESPFTGRPSILSPFTYFRPDAYQIVVSIGSGEFVPVLCFECKADSYKAGDPIEIVREERVVGSPNYKEKTKQIRVYH